MQGGRREEQYLRGKLAHGVRTDTISVYRHHQTHINRTVN